jgi:hypothetical protein
MSYDSTYELGPYTCESSTAGLACSYLPRWAEYRVGIWISREDAYAF